MELNELHVRQWETGSGNHSSTVTGAGVGWGAGLIGSSVTSSCDDGVQGSDSVDGSISDWHDGDTSADSVVHDQVQSEILDEESAVVGQGSAEEGMEHSMTGSVGDGTGSIGLF